MPATPWTEQSLAAGTGWDNQWYVGARPTEFVVVGGAVQPVDGGPPLEAVAWTELTVAATASTEVSISATSWIELSS